jgi:hypothetical protein
LVPARLDQADRTDDSILVWMARRTPGRPRVCVFLSV